SVTLYDRRGTIAEMANIVARNNADVRSLDKVRIEDPFATYEIDIEVQDLAHLTRILSALRASDAVAQADRI
ncbi:MAG: ACT domain-containing protein, partial [Pseudomonadota bacterium]|nr:ACT domain-containing protein [Pseudomonadota bacterium]